MPARTAPVFPVVAFFLALTGSPLYGQILGSEDPIPQDVLQQVVNTLNAPDVLRLSGGARIPQGARIESDIAVLEGSVQVAGTVVGSLLVANGDLRLGPGARVEGTVLIVGGALLGGEQGEVTGEVTVYSRPFRYQVRGGRIELGGEDALGSGFLGVDLGFGEARVGLRTDTSYNRVEGLPVRFGPIVRTGGSNPLALEAFGIWRSISGLNLRSEELGYAFRLRQAIGGRGTALLGAEAFEETRPIEDQGLSDLEASLSTFLLRRDVRDHYDREGWRAFLELRPARLPFEAVLAYSEEEHATPPIRSPWALREGSEPWRPLAAAAEGQVRSVEASILWNSQNDPVEPSDGWWLSLTVRRQVGGELRLRPSAPLVPGSEEVPLEEAEPLPFFTRAGVDLRHYARVGPTSRLVLRAVASGSVTGGPLPPQFQASLGGEGSLPGHFRFGLDCGARQSLRVSDNPDPRSDEARAPVFPAYGCDRTILFQAEFQGALPFSWNPFPDTWEGSGLGGLFELRPVWAVFFNAGQGWARGSLGNGVSRTDSPTRADLGFGVFAGPIGLYWAYPLNRGDRGMNFFVRLERRF